MNAFFAAGVLTLVILLGACAQPPRPQDYAERLSSTWLAADQFTVAYRGNASSRDDEIADLALLRSAEIALQNGFPYFIIVDADAASGANAAGGTDAMPSFTVHAGKRYRLASPGASNTVVGFREKPLGFAYVALFVKASLRAKYGLDQADSGS